MRIALLHTRLSGYFVSCLRALRRRSGCDYLIYAWPNQTDAPFDALQFQDIGPVRNRNDFANAEIQASVLEFAPHALLTSGWLDRGYLRVARRLKRAAVPVVAGCDTQWTGSLRQRVASATAGLHVRRAIDVLWVAGERQATLARALGYSGDYLWHGMYACDWSKFARQPSEAVAPIGSAECSFLFVGRYVQEKGIETLAEAYCQYRRMVTDPWPLVCAGTGPLRDVLRSAGALDLGFIQPENLPNLMKRSSAFVLPSKLEPWGVVVQEAAASGLPLVVSEAVGAGVHLVRQGFNGFSFRAGSANELADYLTKIHHMPLTQRLAFGRNSYQLSRQYTPEQWAETLVSGLERLKALRDVGHADSCK